MSKSDNEGIQEWCWTGMLIRGAFGSAIDAVSAVISAWSRRIERCEFVLEIVHEKARVGDGLHRQIGYYRIRPW
jgi:hypothetical protein